MGSRTTTIAPDVDALYEGMSGRMPSDVAASFGTEQAGPDAGGVPIGLSRSIVGVRRDPVRLS